MDIYINKYNTCCLLCRVSVGLSTCEMTTNLVKHGIQDQDRVARKEYMNPKRYTIFPSQYYATEGETTVHETINIIHYYHVCNGLWNNGIGKQRRGKVQSFVLRIETSANHFNSSMGITPSDWNLLFLYEWALIYNNSFTNVSHEIDSYLLIRTNIMLGSSVWQRRTCFIH